MHYLWEIYSQISSTECRRLSSEFRILTENLRGLQLDFDLGDETLLSEIGAVAEGKLRVGRQSYSMVMVSETDRLEGSTIKLLELFIQQGGKVVFIGKIPGNAGQLNATVQMNNKTVLRKFFLHIHWKFPVQLRTENNRSLVDNVHNFLGVTKDGTRRIGFYLATEGILKQKVRMFIDGRCKVWRVDSLTDKRVLVPAVYHDDFTEVLFELNGRTLALFEAKEMETREKDKDAEIMATKLLKTEIIPLETFDIRLLAPNSFTLDMAELYCDGILIGNRQPLGKIRNLLKKLAETDDKDHVIDIRFVFTSSLPSGTPLSLGLELDSMKQVFCNGFDITREAEQNNWFVDRCIKCIPIGRFVRNGDNEIICRYILNSGDRLHFDGEFETERNRFCPTLEPESIYLIGNFTLKAIGRISHRTVYISVSGNDDFDTSPEFVLCPMEQLKFAPFTEQGLWFYRGNILLETKLPSFPEKAKVKLHIKNVYAALCSVQVNDCEPIPLFSSFVELDITPFMSERENHLKIILFGTNRNLLGPHHHCKGEIDFIGNESFDGILNWTDFFSPDLTEPSTWTDRYSFIPFGMDGCEIVITKPAD